MAGSKLPNTTTEEILKVLTDWSAGQFSRTVAKSSDPVLGPIVDKLNEVAQALKAQNRPGVAGPSQAQANRGLAERTEREDLLGEVQKKLDAVITTSLMGVWEVDSSFRAVYVNQRMADILGSTPSQILGKTAHDFIPQEDRESLSSRLKVREKGQIEVYETRIQRQDDGVIRDILVNATPLFDSTGRFQGTLATLLDITERKHSEAQLASMTERLRLATSSAHLGVWDWDVKNNTMIWDDRMLELYGLTKETFPGGVEAWSNGLHPDDRTRAIEESQAALRGEKPWDTEFRVLHPDGKILWIKANGVVLQGADATPVRMIGVNADITAAKRKDEELRERQQLLSESQMVAKLGSWAIELPSFKQTWSEQTFHNLGLAPDAPVPSFESFLGLLHPDDRPSLQARVKANIAGENPGSIEFRAILPDGSARVFEGRSKLVLDTKNQPIRLLGTILDITERKELIDKLKCAYQAVEAKVIERTAELNESRALLFNAFNNSPLLMTISDLATGKYLEVNDTFCRVSGYSREETIGRTSIELGWLSEESRARLLCELRQHGKVDGLELDLHTKAGKAIVCGFWGEVIQTAQGEKLFSAAEDITERKQLELNLVAAKVAAEGSAKAKARFLDTAAHELRNPITAVSLMLHVVQMQLKNGQVITPATMARLQDPVDRLTHLVGDLLDVSQVERGLMVLRRVTADMVSIISKSVEEFQLRAPSRRFCFSKPDQSVQLECDPVRINQVLSNLLDNAVKYTHEDQPIEITIELMPKTVRVSVIDHGAGIPNEQLGHIFCAFSRGGSDETLRASNGLGLGLSVCRGIIELHGGTIGVMSEVGRGSAFYFELSKNGVTGQESRP